MAKAFKSYLCTEELTDLDNLNVHIEGEHDEVCDRKKKPFKCNVCGYEFSLGKYLLDHMRTHTGERPFKCTADGCGMGFKQESTLTDHVKFKHSNERPFKCDFPGCLHATKTAPDLSKHKKVHTVERPFACSNIGCSFRAKWKNHLRRHVQSVHSEATEFACTMCEYKTTSNSNLKVHSRRHSGRRDFKCKHPQCGKSFKRSSHLRSHFINQHEEKNIQCDHPGCGRKYASTSALNYHRRVVHLKKSRTCPNPDCSFSTSKASNLARHMIVHEGSNEKISCLIGGSEKKLNKPYNSSGRPFHCPLCSKRFKTLDNLQQHCVVHTNERPFKCGHCEFAAGRLVSVKTHLSSLHPDIQFPFIVHLLDDHECLNCKVILPSAQFLVHCKGHESPVVIM